MKSFSLGLGFKVRVRVRVKVKVKVRVRLRVMDRRVEPSLETRKKERRSVEWYQKSTERLLSNALLTLLHHIVYADAERERVSS
jgi:hypothetical protein